MADQFVIEVNEGPVEISRQGVEWWHARRQLLEASGKLVETTVPCIVGGKVEVGPYSREDADFMAEHMVTVGGMPKSAVRVKPLKAITRS